MSNPKRTANQRTWRAGKVAENRAFRELMHAKGWRYSYALTAWVPRARVQGPAGTR